MAVAVLVVMVVVDVLVEVGCLIDLRRARLSSPRARSSIVRCRLSLPKHRRSMKRRQLQAKIVITMISAVSLEWVSYPPACLKLLSFSLLLLSWSVALSRYRLHHDALTEMVEQRVKHIDHDSNNKENESSLRHAGG